MEALTEHEQPRHPTASAYRNRHRRGLRRDWLPDPVVFYAREFSRILPRANSQGWVGGLPCPKHDSKSKKSFSVNIRSGGFKCWGCDLSGSSVVRFVMATRDLTFVDACRELKAWDDSELDAKQVAELRAAHVKLVRQQQAQQNAETERKQAERALRLEYRDQILAFEESLRLLRRQLKEPDADRLLITECVVLVRVGMRDSLAAYTVLAFANQAARQQFVDAPIEQRFRICDEVNLRGYVVADDGKHIEVLA